MKKPSDSYGSSKGAMGHPNAPARQVPTASLPKMRGHTAVTPKHGSNGIKPSKQP